MLPTILWAFYFVKGFFRDLRRTGKTSFERELKIFSLSILSEAKGELQVRTGLSLNLQPLNLNLLRGDGPEALGSFPLTRDSASFYTAALKKSWRNGRRTRYMVCESSEGG